MTSVEVQRRTWTVREYHRMIEVGLLGEDDRVELLGGEIIAKMPIGSRHAATVTRIDRQTTLWAGERYLVRAQHPVTLDDASEPEPDVALVAWRDDFYAAAHPGPADVALLVEVADSSLLLDRRLKLPLYAAAGVPESWLVDLVDELVEVHSGVSPDGYATIDVARRGAQVRSVTIPDLVLDVDAILGPAPAGQVTRPSVSG